MEQVAHVERSTPDKPALRIGVESPERSEGLQRIAWAADRRERHP